MLKWKERALSSRIDTREWELTTLEEVKNQLIKVSLPKRIFDTLCSVFSQKLNNYTAENIINENDPLK